MVILSQFSRRMIYLPSCLTDLGRKVFILWFDDYITMDSIKLVGPGDTINSLEVYRVLSAQLGAAAIPPWLTSGTDSDLGTRSSRNVETVKDIDSSVLVFLEELTLPAELGSFELVLST